jgi:pimeloyl-ACP methyl ester carboxylesterase
MVNAIEPWPLRPVLQQITCPVVLVIGEAPHEGGPDATAREQMGTIPRFTLAPLAGVGLYAFEEAPNLVADVIRRAVPVPTKATGATNPTGSRAAWTKL